MRYIKEYNSSDFDEISKDIETICLDLQDDGFTVKLYGNHLHSVIWVHVANGYDYNIKHIQSYIDRIDSCVKSYGWYGKSLVKKKPASEGSTTSELPAGGFIIQYRKLNDIVD